MSVGLGLLHKILVERLPMSALAELSVKREDFTGPERSVFDLVVRHVEEHGRHPQLETVSAECGIEWPSFPDEPIGYWVGRVERRKRTQMILSGATEMTQLAGDGEVDEAAKKVRDLWVELSVKDSGDRVHALSDVAGEVLEYHDRRQHSEGMQGVPFGIPYLDEISDGAQGSDTVALVGRPGTGKTYFLLSMANAAYNEGRTPLVLEMEMSVRQCARRLMAIRSSIPADMIRLGRLSYYGREHLAANLGSLREIQGRPFYLMQGSLSSTVEDLVLRVQELRPSALYVDGAYLLSSRKREDSRWERVAYTAEFLKRIATEFDIPVIATYQFNRRGPGSIGNIAFSDSVGQLASIVIGIADEQEEDSTSWAAVTYKTIELLKGREGERGTIRCVYDMSRMQIRQDSVIRGGRLQSLAEDGGGDG